MHATGINDGSGTSMALVHAPRTGIPIAHGRVSQTNTPRDRGIYEEMCYKRPGLAKGRRRELLGEMNYTEPATQIKGKFETILCTWGGDQPEEIQDQVQKLIPERKRFSVPHESRDPGILKDRNLENEDIFEIIRNPPEVGAVRIFDQPETWDSTTGPTQAATKQGIATIQLPSGPLSVDGAQWHLLQHTLTNAEPTALGASLQNELLRHLKLDTEKKHRSFSWELLRTVKGVYQATKYQGDTALIIPPIFKNAGRGKERIWGEDTATPQPTVINWPGLNNKERSELTPTLSTTDN